MDPKVTINYPCSKCEAPIQLDASFAHMSEHTKAEIALPVFRGHEFVLPSDDEAAAGYIDKIVQPLTLSANSCSTDAFLLHSNITGLDERFVSSSVHGYTILGCPPRNSNERTPALKVTSELLDLASTNSNLDHPLCEECTDALLQQVDKQLTFTAAKARSYTQLLDQLKNTRAPNIEHLELQLKELELEEKELEAEVQEILAEQEEVKKTLEEKRQQAIVLADEEERYLIECCKQRSLWFDAEEERISFHNQKVHSQLQLEKLKQTNIFNIAFHIWKDDHISTINNFRLGRLPTMQVSWTEINAALGQMALLLCSIARKFQLNFSKYEIVPYGNHSYVKVKGPENRILPLYHYSVIKMMVINTSFDLAMVAFLECFVELVQHLERRSNTTLSLPYPINKHLLEDPQAGARYSIKTQFNPDEQWTKALKFLLTNLKWALTWVSAPALCQPSIPAASRDVSSRMQSSATRHSAVAQRR
uniref:Beclin-1-like protein n=1 Tax=Hirondellea gigas TaxID=1518452 RepID=A0A2P2HZR8_9CRUS